MALICGHRLPLKLLVSTVVRTTGTSKTLEAFESATVQLMMDCRSKLEVPKSICGWWSISATTQVCGQADLFHLPFDRPLLFEH